MATAVENLITRRDVLAAELADLTSRPNFTADGINVDWQSHAQTLVDQIERLNKLIIEMSGPAVEVTYGY